MIYVEIDIEFYSMLNVKLLRHAVSAIYVYCEPGLTAPNSVTV